MYVRRRKQYINALSQRAHIHKNSKHNDFDYIINNFINPELVFGICLEENVHRQ